MNLNEIPIAYIITPGLCALLIPFLYSKKAAVLLKFLLFSIGVIIFSVIAPIYIADAQIVSLGQLMLHGNFYLIGMLLAYISAWGLLFKDDNRYHKLSLYIFGAGYLLYWVGVVSQFGWDSKMTYSAEDGPTLQNLSRISMILYLLLPIVNLVIYLLLSYPKKAVDQHITGSEILQIKLLGSNLAKVITGAVVLGSIYLLFSSINLIDKNNFALTFAMVLITLIAIWKMLQSLFIYRIDFDHNNHLVTLHKTFTKSVIKREDVTSWGIKEYDSDYIFAPAGAMSYVEIEMTGGKKTSYPLVSWEYGREELPKFRSAFESIFGAPPIALKPSRDPIFSKNWWWFLTV